MTTCLKQGVKTFKLYAGCLDLRDTQSKWVEEIKLDPRLKNIVDSHLFDVFYSDDYSRAKLDMEGMCWPDFYLLEEEWFEKVITSWPLVEAIELTQLFGTLLANDQFTAVPVYGDIKDFTVLEE